MKITAVKHFALKISFRSVLVVKVETDQEVYGLGEAGISGRERAVAGMIEHFARFLVGQDPRRIEHLWQQMYRGQYFEGGTIISAAVSAVDIALWDILAKSAKLPLYQLLGGRSRNYVPCYTHAGTLNGPQCVQTAKARVAQGWHVLRFAPGMPDQSSDPQDVVYEPRQSMALATQWLDQVRQAVGPQIQLCVDFHHRLNVAEAADFCRQVEPLNLLFVEEPIRSESPKAYAALRRMTRIPLAVGEEFSSKWAFAPFLEDDLLNFARVDVCNVGGISEAKKVAGWCEAHYIDLVPHNPLGPVATAATAHLCTALSNVAVQEHAGASAQFPAELFRGGPQLDGDRLYVSEQPGLGVEFNEAAAKDYGFEYWEPPHYQRPDGSYTNW